MLSSLPLCSVWEGYIPFPHLHVRTLWCSTLIHSKHITCTYLNLITVFIRILAAATINFSLPGVRLLIERGFHYFGAIHLATIPLATPSYGELLTF